MRKTYIIVAIILCLFFGIEYIAIMPNKNTINEYNALLNQCYELKEHKKPFEAIQKKTGVFKDLFFEKGNKKLQMRIFSDSCDFVYQKTNAGIEMIEKHKNLNCILQEDLIVDTEKNETIQILKLIKAKDAIYYLSKDKLLADNAEIMQYKVKSGEIPQSFIFDGELMMKTFVNKVELELKNKEMVLYADEIKGDLIK